MTYQKHCPSCFTLKDAVAVCPHCGFDESTARSALFLPYGTVLAGQYRVGRVLGKPGGFGITYRARDVQLNREVAIKEYLPTSLAIRREGITVLPRSTKVAWRWRTLSRVAQNRIAVSASWKRSRRFPRIFFKAGSAARSTC